jgi:hypothetical protein
MKLNMRLRGANWFLHPNDIPQAIDNETMIVGADVGHSPPGKGNPRPPSIAVVVSEVGRGHTTFATEIREQEPDENKKAIEWLVYLKGELVSFDA